MEIVEAVVCTIRFFKMKDHLLFYREFSILYIGERVVVGLLSNFEREAALIDSAL